MAVVIIGLVLIATALLGLLIVIGVHRETSWQPLDTKPPTPLTSFTRRLLGVHVRKPDHDRADEQGPRPLAPLGRR